MTRRDIYAFLVVADSMGAALSAVLGVPAALAMFLFLGFIALVGFNLEAK